MNPQFSTDFRHCCHGVYGVRKISIGIFSVQAGFFRGADLYLLDRHLERRLSALMNKHKEISP